MKQAKCRGSLHKPPQFEHNVPFSGFDLWGEPLKRMFAASSWEKIGVLRIHGKHAP
jgi:hypothetical protein